MPARIKAFHAHDNRRITLDKIRLATIASQSPTVASTEVGPPIGAIKPDGYQG